MAREFNYNWSGGMALPMTVMVVYMLRSKSALSWRLGMCAIGTPLVVPMANTLGKDGIK
eukprot:CAMPEP_0116883562 /NCGR_PEP_ID=MMETSP0463-20121206/16102_1 /TAXON_ID=181622 /ORGANISM="Strombidinopsis sp, Strain SopsisLIS2011" /LENGTH=58 /DNA_ID=CAMNT_0004538487 /DNA_START=333 /DNA_END=509 /DNA_ORIENTATION=+